MHADAAPPFVSHARVLRGVVWCVLVGLQLCMAAPRTEAQILRQFETRAYKTPGLRCWGIRGGMASKILVYVRPVAGAPALGHTVSMVAATGRPVGGYLPVYISSGVSGWIRLAEVERDRWTGQRCVVRREANGYLTSSHGQGATP